MYRLKIQTTFFLKKKEEEEINRIKSDAMTVNLT